ncbi:MAG: transporter substrate-binding domain-containing protein [Actinobacteria bacterium]|nr:transporter substrate-binding domain-containing protein [Actinomycetota bacterium]
MKHGRWSSILALLAALALVGAACAEDNPTVGGGDGTSSPTAQLPAFETIEEGVLKVGSCLDYEPFESVVDGDEVGFDVDLTEEIADRLGLRVEWVTANFETIFTAVAGGQFDMVAAAVTATGDLGEERDETVDFSDFYYNSRQSIAVNTQETPDIQSGEDLGEGHIVGVQRGTTGAAYANENLKPQGVEIKTFAEAPAALRDLEAGQVTAVVNDEPSTAEIIKEMEGVEIIEAIDTNEKYAVAFSPDNPELTQAVDQALAEIIEDGTYEEIFHTYFPDVEVPEEFQAAT